MVEPRTESELHHLFMSAQNRSNLHELIRKETYRLTGRLIGRQSDTELRNIQRIVYSNYAQNRPDDLVQQINALNQQTLRFCINSIQTNMAERQHYLDSLDANLHARPQQVMPLPQATETVVNREVRLQDRGLDVFNPYR